MRRSLTLTPRDVVPLPLRMEFDEGIVEIQGPIYIEGVYKMSAVPPRECLLVLQHRHGTCFNPFAG
jgi:hypothetical protein